VSSSKSASSAPALSSALPRLEPLEIHSGVIIGERRTPLPPSPLPELTGPPLEVLKSLLLEPLSNPPCRVAFSGGRDSSAILAVATVVARENGLPDPIPLTARLEDHPRTWETDWQELAIRHLELQDWETVPITTELDALGPVATGALRRYGLYWPSQAHSIIVFARHGGSGSLVTGGGGDEVFTPWSGRRLRYSELSHVRPLRRAARWMAFYSLPRRLRTRIEQSRYNMHLPWMRPDAEREVQRLRLERALMPTNAWSVALEGLINSRYREFVRGVLDTFAADCGVALHEPFYDPRFVRSIAAAAPPDGYPSRTLALREHFEGLLPPEVWTRGTKAVFTEVAWGPDTRSFIESWDGTGLDDTLVDPEAVRAQWTGPHPDPRTLICLGQAWLAGQTRAGSAAS
jgi:asparagine synthetase B (glutamine-hydrolysing)